MTIHRTHSNFAALVGACVLATVAALPAGAAPPPAPDAPPDISHGVVMTRGMKIFGDAEARIVAAIKAKDSAALDRLVAPDFEQRTQAAPGDAVPRGDWLKAATSAAATSSAFRQMAVHDFGDTMVVSFQWLHPAPDFVVDVWRRQGDDWQLGVRYLSPAAAGPASPSAADHARKPLAGPASSPVDPTR